MESSTPLGWQLIISRSYHDIIAPTSQIIDELEHLWPHRERLHQMGGTDVDMLLACVHAKNTRHLTGQKSVIDIFASRWHDYFGGSLSFEAEKLLKQNVRKLAQDSPRQEKIARGVLENGITFLEAVITRRCGQ